MARKATDTVRINLRLSTKMHRQLSREAAENKHSLNDEIIDCVIRAHETNTVEEMIAKVSHDTAMAMMHLVRGGPPSSSNEDYWVNLAVERDAALAEVARLQGIIKRSAALAAKEEEDEQASS
jgi:uncharacterized protein (DUF1778 family)